MTRDDEDDRRMTLRTRERIGIFFDNEDGEDCADASEFVSEPGVAREEEDGFRMIFRTRERRDVFGGDDDCSGVGEFVFGVSTADGREMGSLRRDDDRRTTFPTRGKNDCSKVDEDGIEACKVVSAESVDIEGC